MDTPLYGEDFINHMLSISDYDIEDICEFAGEHMQNQLSLEDNVNNFIEWVDGGSFCCINCGGGFKRHEIVTDENGDDFCTSCK